MAAVGASDFLERAVGDGGFFVDGGPALSLEAMAVVSLPFHADRLL